MWRMKSTVSTATRSSRAVPTTISVAKAQSTYPQVDPASPRLSLRHNYTSLGFLYFIDDPSDNSLYWAATGRDVSGQVTSEYTRNGVETTSIRNQATGWLRGSSSVAHADGDTLIQNWSYRFDEVGNLRSRSRSDAVNGAPSHEAFTYDDAQPPDRLGRRGGHE